MSPSHDREDETHAQRERRIADEKEDRKKIVAALGKLADNAGEHKTHVRRIVRGILEWGTLLGIWVAAFVAVWAVLRSSHDSREQSGVMRQQLDVTLVQLRAYVAADSFNVTAIQKNPGDPPDEVGGVDLQPVFKNFGATPAKDVSTWNCGKVLSNEEAKQFGFRHDDCQYPNDPSNVDRTVGPGGQVLGSKFMVRGDDMTKVARGQQIYLWGEITYSETFPHTPVHHYRYCRRALVASATYVPIYAYEPRCNFAD